MSQSKSLFNQTFPTDGYLLDTTWRVLSHYVTCILTVCFYNTSIPIAFAFGNGETIDLYDKLLKTVSKQLNITFKNSIFETDQGPALKSICQQYKIKMHLKCLRHMIHSFKNIYSFELTTLVKCVSIFDFDNCCNYFDSTFKKRCEEDPNQLKIINTCLKKNGLIFTNDKISVNDSLKWEQVSMSCRVKYHMPSTTNSLEATHGQFNARTPRRNTLFSAILRIHNEMNSKFLNISQRIQHNYNYVKRKTIERQKF